MINPLYMNDLDEMETEVSEENKESFKINDLSSLSWALRKLSAIEAKKADITQLVKKEQERIEKYRKKELDKLQISEEFFNFLITEYAERMKKEDPKFKQSTPYGSIGFKKQQPKWNYDEDKLITYLKDNQLNEFIRIKEESNKADIKKQFKLLDNGKVVDVDGQEVEGITVEFLPEKLTIKVGE